MYTNFNLYVYFKRTELVVSSSCSFWLIDLIEKADEDFENESMITVNTEDVFYTCI